MLFTDLIYISECYIFIRTFLERLINLNNEKFLYFPPINTGIERNLNDKFNPTKETITTLMNQK